MASKESPSSLEELETVYLECRDYLHAWKLQAIEREGVGFLIRNLRCTRCKTERFDTLRVDGTVYARNYKHPRGYLLSGAEPDPDRKIHTRVELFKRLMG